MEYLLRVIAFIKREQTSLQGCDEVLLKIKQELCQLKLNELSLLIRKKIMRSGRSFKYV